MNDIKHLVQLIFLTKENITFVSFKVENVKHIFEYFCVVLILLFPFFFKSTIVIYGILYRVFFELF